MHTFRHGKLVVYTLPHFPMLAACTNGMTNPGIAQCPIARCWPQGGGGAGEGATAAGEAAEAGGRAGGGAGGEEREIH